MDFAENWCSLLELFVSSAGLKLRMQLVDTVLFKSGRALGHFYTNRDGAVCRFSAHEITRSSIYQRLASLHNLDPALNPYGYIAVAHYTTGVSRLLKRAELQELMSVLSGPYEFGEGAAPHLAAQHEGLFCLQSYLVPGRDMRYIASYDLSEGPLCTVLGRRYSARYTHALDDPTAAQPLEAFGDHDDPAAAFGSRPPSSAAMARPTSAIDGRPQSAAAGGDGARLDHHDSPPNGAAVPRTSLTAEELLVESQLVAMGLLEPRRAAAAGGGVKDGRGASTGSGGSYGGAGEEEGEEEGAREEAGAGKEEGEEGHGAPDGVRSSLPAPKRVKDDVAKILQAISSFVERAHGQRIVGLVSEFVVAAGPGAPAGMGGGLVLTAVHAVQLDPRASRGRLGTFTERWGDYLEGLAPAPAPQAPARRNQAPSVLRGSDSSLVMTDRATGLLLRTAPGPAAAAVAAQVSPYNGASMGTSGALSPYDRLSVNAPPSPSGSLFSPSGAARGGGGGGGAVVLAASPRVPGGGGGGGGAPPSSPGGALTRIYSASPSAAHHRAVAAVGGDYSGRPGSAPAAVVKVGRHVANSAHASAANGHYSLRNAMSAARPGAGGNPTGTPGGPESYNLWLNRDGGPGDSMSARLALEVEALRERLQRQTDIAVRAEVALQQLAVSSAREAFELRTQIEELRIEVGRLGEAKRNLGSEYERLRTERLGLQAGRSELGTEVEKLREQLAAERETLSRSVRDAGAREESLEAALRAAREEREEALGQVGGLRRRLEEEGEVVEALRGQLYDYKQLTAQLQAQVRRGRNNKQMLQSLGGLPPSIPSVANLVATGGGAGGGGGGGAGGVRASNTKEGGDDSDGETDLVGSAAMAGGGGGGDQAPGTPASGGGAGHKANNSSGGVSAARAGPRGKAGASRLATVTSINNSTGPNPFRDEMSAAIAGLANPYRASTAAGVDLRSAAAVSATNIAPRAAAAGGAGAFGKSQPSSAAVELSVGAFSSLLGGVRRRRLGADTAPLTIDRVSSNRDLAGTAAAAAAGGGAFPPVSPTGSTGATTFDKDGAGKSGGGAAAGRPSSSTGGAATSVTAPALGARKPNYEALVAHDLFLMSWTREALTARMLECHGSAIKLVAEEETTLAEIFNFYAQLGQVVWLDNRLSMNERQFIKLACETGVLEASAEDTREVFRKVSDKTEFNSEASANHPFPFIYFEQFPEAVMRLAALRYEWRPPENLEDAEEELYFASPPFMPPTTSRADDAADTPPRPPETTLLQIIKTYIREDLLPKARRFKTAGSARARMKSGRRTAPQGLWVSSKSTTAGV
ncbi:hypothetical protein HYH02_008924 [Chlamydomonas schloesseri]|uniref:Uncharacterized protein n=1 Tax=Chlamydomonas schloesseri TaxID=2026947 RepID=A0A836B1Q1_9CHLO|nr:hypothetical protein HYH02_008924 [Chlamydomonas schloesseri]|eukprot:KAG2445056.1 hypothetical protein HYH02_008924 [Chlamydomonas schloesseri]